MVVERVDNLEQAVATVTAGITYLPADASTATFGDIYATIPSGRDWRSRQHGGSTVYRVRASIYRSQACGGPLQAAVSRVGASNPLRFENTQGGPANIPEFGTVANRDDFEALRSFDPYINVKPDTKYPAVLLTTGMNDPRVPPWQPGKMAARLQASTTSGKPVLLRVEFDAGHGLGSTRSQFREELADTYSFLLWQFGEPGFTPAPVPTPGR